MSERNTADIFSSLLSDPAALSSIASLLAKIQPQTPSTSESTENTSCSAESAQSTEQAQSTSSPPPDLSGMIGSVMSNPELMAALPSVVGALSGMLGAGRDTVGGQTQSTQNAHDAGIDSQLRAVLPGMCGGGAYPRPPRPTDRRSALLLALKPYMPPEKGETIDTIVRIIEIMSLIK